MLRNQKPSFKINGALSKAYKNVRWDSFNSSKVILEARAIYFDYLLNNKQRTRPIGVILKPFRLGSVIHKNYTILPDEIFIPIDVILHRH